MSDTGELTGCQTGDNANGEYCTRDDELRAGIAEGCQVEGNYTLITFVYGCNNVTMFQCERALQVLWTKSPFLKKLAGIIKSF